MASPRPRIYISSTIFDFADLRSALKCYLEDRGYQVLMSEFNDFEKPLEPNSYEACLRAIESADYFILLVGARVGGWYDQANRVTITRQEYRHAYQRAKSAKLRLVCFVRSDIWIVREDRKELERLLIGRRNVEAESSLVHHPSRFVHDASFTFDFLREIGRVAEMKAALDGKHERPVANWVHLFATFEDIVQALSVQLNVRKSIARVALERNLRHEVMEIARSLCSRYSDRILPAYAWAEHARRKFKGGYDASSAYSRSEVTGLSAFLTLGSVAPFELTTQAIDESLRSGEFLEFDRSSGEFKDSPLVLLLRRLRRELALLDARQKAVAKHSVMTLIEEARNKGGSSNIPNSEIAIVMGCHDTQYNVLSLCRGLIEILDGRCEDPKVPMYKCSPLADSDIEAARPSDGELLDLMDQEFSPEAKSNGQGLNREPIS